MDKYMLKSGLEFTTVTEIDEKWSKVQKRIANLMLDGFGLIFVYYDTKTPILDDIIIDDCFMFVLFNMQELEND